MEIICRQSEWLRDWYCLYEGEDYISDACVEGTLVEMKSLAQAIRERGYFSSYRCAVTIYFNNLGEGWAEFWSPRNSGGDFARVPLEEADVLAAQIETL